MSERTEPPSAAETTVSLHGPLEGTVTVRGHGILDAASFAAALTAAAGSGATTVLLDLTAVEYFSMEAAAALLAYQLADPGAGHRTLLQPSPAVERKLATLGLDAVLARVPKPLS